MDEIYISFIAVNKILVERIKELEKDKTDLVYDVRMLIKEINDLKEKNKIRSKK